MKNYLKLLLFIPVLFSGCVTTVSTVTPREPAKAGSSYVAGKFLLSHSEWAPRMALALRREGTDKEIYIELEKEVNYVGLSLVNLEPGKYELVDVIKFSGSGDGIMDRVPFKDFPHSTNFVLEPDQIVYVGNYDGQSYHRIDSMIITPYYMSASRSGSAAFTFEFDELESIKKTIFSEYKGYENFLVRGLNKK